MRHTLPRTAWCTVARLALATVTSLLSCAVNANTHGLLEQAAEYVTRAVVDSYPRGRVAVNMVPLDPRLQLNRCDDLAFDIPGARMLGRVAVHARCRAPTSWQVYATAMVQVTLPVVSLTRPVPRDSVLRPGDVTLVEQDLGRLRDGYLTDPADAVGMSARTSLRAAATLYQHQLAAPTLVSRGDTVMLATQVGPVTVRTQVEALSDGVYGEQVDVRNPRSDKVLSAWVTGAGRVSTRP